MTVGMRWSREDCATLLKMRADGKTCKVIAEYFGVTAHAVNVKIQRLRNPNLHRERPKQPSSGKTAPWQRNGERWTEQENADLIARRDSGESFQSIGIRLNRTTWSCKLQYHSLKRGTASTPGAVQLTQRTNREAVNERIHEVRCAPLRYASPFSEMLGEPPIGRRAIDQKREGAGA